MPQTSQDESGRRVIIQHKGPPGPGVVSGGTAGQLLAKISGSDFATMWVDPPNGTDGILGPLPAVSVDGRVALFDGTTGRKLKVGSLLLSELATKAELSGYQEKITGAGLSTEDFTLALKDKLVGLETHVFYRGHFVDEYSLNVTIIDPHNGDYATVGDPAIEYHFRANSGGPYEWYPLPEVPDATEIAAALFDDGSSWSKAQCVRFTPSEKATLAAHESLFVNLNLGSVVGSIARLFGEIFIYEGNWAQAVSDVYVSTAESFNTANGYNGLSSDVVPDKATGKMTAPTAGTYKVTYTASLFTTTNDIAVTLAIFAGALGAPVFIAGSECSQTSPADSDSVTRIMSFTGTKMVPLSASQVVELYIKTSDSGSNAVKILQANLSMEKINAL